MDAIFYKYEFYSSLLFCFCFSSAMAAQIRLFVGYKDNTRSPILVDSQHITVAQLVQQIRATLCLTDEYTRIFIEGDSEITHVQTLRDGDKIVITKASGYGIVFDP